MKIEFRLNFKDYQEANKAHLKHQKNRYYSTWFLVIISILLSIVNFIIGNLVSGILLLLLGILLNPQFTVFPKKFILKKTWNNHSNTLRQPMEIEATAKSFFVKGENFETTVEWKIFSKFIETENLFILYEGKIQFRIVPKRAFANNEELQEFRMMLKENISLNSISV